MLPWPKQTEGPLSGRDMTVNISTTRHPQRDTSTAQTALRLASLRQRSSSRSLLRAISALSMLSVLSACQADRPTLPPVRQNGDPSQPDIGVLDLTTEEPAPTPITLCTPSSLRCLAQDSPLFERCDAQGRSLNIEACPSGHICRQDQCIPFSCTPERPVCVGPTTEATCDASGRSVLNPKACPAGQACRNGYCIDLCQEAAQDKSYIGCTYVAQELHNLYRTDPGSQDKSPFAIILANPHPLLEVNVNVRAPDGAPAGLIRSLTLEPTQQYAFAKKTTVRSAIISGTRELARLGAEARAVSIPPNAAAVLLMDTDGDVKNTFFIDADQPVVAYQFSPYCCNFTATNDASLLLPIATLQSRYRVLSYPSMKLDNQGILSLQPYIYVVAQEDDTTVVVQSPTQLTDDFGEIGQRADPTQAEQKNWSFTLKRGEAKALRIPQDQDADLSGALVASDKPIAVFSGHPCTFVPRQRWACDHLEEQLPPADILGKDYLLPSFKTRNPKYDPSLNPANPGEQLYWRISADADAQITFEPSLKELDTVAPSNPVTPNCRDLLSGSTLKLKEGQTCEFGTQQALTLSSDAPVIVGGVLSGHQSTGLEGYGKQAGDPALFILPPSEQFRTSYSFVTAPTFKKTYAVILAQDNATVALDGQQISSRKQLELERVSLDGKTWRVYSIELDPGVHQLKAASAFGLVVYAYDDYVSYAFPGGLDLRPRGKE